MRRKIMALLDPDAVYTVHFTEYAARRANIPFEVHAFTETEAFRAFAENESVEILLVSSRLADPEIVNTGIPNVVVLAEEQGSTDVKTGCPAVFKYQSQAEVLREVMDLYGRTARADQADRMMKPKMRTIGITSPVGRSGKTSLALALGQILATKKKTLYVNLEPFSGLSGTFQATSGGNLTDLIFCLRQDEGAGAARLSGMTIPLGGLDILPAARPGREIFSVGEEDWGNLFELLRRGSGYEVLLLDIGCGIRGCLTCLRECDLIFMPVRNEPGAHSKTEEFFSWLRDEKADDVIEKIRRLNLKDTGSAAGGSYFKDLPYTVYGGWAKELIRREGL